MKARKLVVTLALATALAAGSIVAFAAWTATGSGSGTATARTAVSLTVSAVTPSGCLFPGAAGASACPVQFTVSNPNPYPVSLNKLTLGSITAVTPTNAALTGCDNPGDTHGVTVNTEEQTLGTPIVISAGGTSTTQTSPLLVSMNNTSHNDCQGALFTIDATVSGTSSSA